MAQQILVPLDGSALAEAALPAAIALARVEGCSLELLAVVEALQRGPDPARLMSLVRQGLEARLHGVAERLRAEGLRVELAVRDGEPADAILGHASERRSRLVVLTTRGLGGLERWLVGSVADKVVRLAPCSVLLIRPASAAVDLVKPWRPQRLLVPLDGSTLAEQALPLAYRWAAGLGAEVLLARVQPWLAVQFAAADGYLPDMGTWEEEAAQAGATYLDSLRQQAPPRIAVRTRALRGDPAACLLACSDDESIDLVVMTSHSRSGLGRLVLGSVADRLARHGPPICIIHPTIEEHGAEATHSASSVDV